MTAPDVPLLVVVSGPAAAGKSTIARALADELRLPLIAKDDIKETLFDHVGTGDRAWSRRLGVATFALQRQLAAELLRAGVSFVLEANFDAEHDPLPRLPPHRAIQIYCTAPRDVLLERYKTRTRHPGHLDDQVLGEMHRGEHDDRVFRLDVVETIDVDTTTRVEIEALADEIRRHRGSAMRPPA